MKLRFIVNVRSGRAQRALPHVRAFAGRRGADVVITQRASHGRELAREAVDQGIEVVVAVGGDGTMNEVASALVGTGATLGLVPCGSGDGLGRHLGLHGTPTRALDILDEGRPFAIDVGYAGGEAFFTAAGFGFEAEIAQRFNCLERRGFARYITTSAKAFRSCMPEAYTLIANGTRTTFEAFTVAVANANQYGNNAYIAPQARLDDGLLNLTAVPPVTWWNAAPLVTRLFLGSVHAVSGVRSFAGSKFRIERASPGPFHTDGELHEGGTILDFEVRPRALRVMVPTS